MESYNSWLTKVLLLLFPVVCYSQQHETHNPWTFVSENAFFRSAENQNLPAKFKTLRLDVKQLKILLSEAPDRQSEGDLRSVISIQFPQPDGSFESYNIVEASVMHPDLSAKYPDLKSYAGYGITDPSAYLRFSLSSQGLHAMILSGNHPPAFIDPLKDGEPELSIVFSKSNLLHQHEWSCNAELAPFRIVEPETSALRNTQCQLRTYRLALSCTGEYTLYHGGTVASALTAVVKTLTRVNGIYERYAGISMLLVAQNDKIIFTDPTTDPFNNNSGSAMLSQNQQTCDNIIGNANYDIGHVFSTGGGGIAYMRNVCNALNKAGGVTGRANPTGDAFDIDYVCHELGHQFGASHTQCNNCNRNNNTAVEPGSGSTIMSYAGICTPNVQSNSDAYFHSVSLEEIRNFISASGTCGHMGTSYSVPVANAGLDYSIPRSTPFVLTGKAEAGNSAALLWNWEQIDNDFVVMPPSASQSAGPSFRSYQPGTSSSRHFPNMNSLRNNQTFGWEVLPDVGRNLKFRLLVIDNTRAAGCFSHDDMRISVEENAGPFIITSPNGSESWTTGTKQFVSWLVAGTSSSPVNCHLVDILMSTDGGLTFPIVIVQKTPNDGFEEITVPQVSSGNARIMVRASENIFFDISNTDFTVKAAPVLFIAAQIVNPNCFGDNKGKASAIVSGGSGDYTYAWSNGASTQTIENLASGTYSVTVSSGPSKATATFNIGQPSPLLIQVNGQEAYKGNDGWARVFAAGGAGSYTYAWSNGSITSTIQNLTPGIYSVTVTDANNCKASGSINLSGSELVKMEYGTLRTVNHNWQKVTLKNNYNSMVVVASIVVLDNTGPALVTRIRNVGTNSFEIRAQMAGDESAEIVPILVHYLVVEEGVYNKEKYGVSFEAKKYYSVKTSVSNGWKFESQPFGQTYNNPVVVGQVMSYNDPKWSVFWSSLDGDRTEPANSESLSVGKHIAADEQYPYRSPEILGYLVFEEGYGTINGNYFMCSVGAQPKNSGTGNTYYSSENLSVESAFITSAAMNTTEGGWPILKKPRAGLNSIKAYFTNNQSNGERSLADEHVAFIVIGKENKGLLTYQGKANMAGLNTNLSLRAFPNPAATDVSWELENSTEYPAKVELYDFLGRRVQNAKTYDLVKGKHSGSFQLNGLEPGLYWIRSEAAGAINTAPVIISK